MLREFPEEINKIELECITQYTAIKILVSSCQPFMHRLPSLGLGYNFVSRALSIALSELVTPSTTHELLKHITGDLAV